MPSLALFDLTLPTPAENLACDEALLEWCENGTAAGALRFWESTDPFVVLGYSNEAAREVNLAACLAEGVPVRRRISGGGTVLQGPGSFNYALVLRLAHHPELIGITGANRFIMERNANALSEVIQRPVAVRGFTDLALDDRKFSGNAQRRKRHCILFHGTILLQFDAARLDRLLPLPSREPGYRQGRGHAAFLTCLSAERSSIKTALHRAWNPDVPVGVGMDQGNPFPGLSSAIEGLVANKYARPEWNRSADFQSAVSQVF